MTIDLIVNGARIDGYKNVVVKKSLRSFASEFAFVTTGIKTASPVQLGDEVEMVVDETTVLVGHVEKIDVTISVSDDTGEHDVTYSGRDFLGDLIDNTLGGNEFEFNTPITLTQIAEQILDNFDIKGVLVFPPVNAIEPFKENELVKPDVAQTAFDFLEQYARSRQVLLTNDGFGNILLYNDPVGTIANPIINELNAGRRNNILASSLTIDYTKRFNKYIVRSQQNPVALNESLPDDYGEEILEDTNFNDIFGEAVDSEIRENRVLNIIAENAGDVEQATNRAIWEANIQRASSKKYTVVMQGHSHDRLTRRQPWLIGRTVQVVDETASVNATLLISDVEYHASVDDGTSTRMLLVTPDAYTLNAQPNAEGRAAQLGVAWTEQDLRESIERARRSLRETFNRD